MKRDYYSILGVHPLSNADEIKKAYFERCRLLAPHQDPMLKLRSSPEMTEIIDAYNILRSPVSRKEYDRLPRFRVRTDKNACVTATTSLQSAKVPSMEDKTMRMHFPKPVSDKEKQAGVHFQMGVSILTEHEELEQASQEFKLALRYDPAHPGALYNLGLITYKKGNFKEALSWFTRFQEHMKDNRDGDEMMQSLMADPAQS